MDKEFELQATELIHAKPKDIFKVIRDLGKFDQWSPFALADKTVTSEFSDPSAGVGAIYEYSGSRVGQGRMVITAEVKDKSVSLGLDFIKPSPSQATADFIITEAGDGCLVTWRMQGIRTPGARFFAKLLNLDKMLVKSFHQGLLALKELVE